jgi:hypothetical protein
MLALHYTLGIAFSMRLDKRVSMLGREEISVAIRNFTFYSLLSASIPRVMFEASLMTANAANRKLKYWQTLPNSAHLLISAFMCSRFLKGWFSKLLAMTGYRLLFFLFYSSMISSCIKDLRRKVQESLTIIILTEIDRIALE